MKNEKQKEILNNCLQFLDKLKTEGVQNAVLIVNIYNGISTIIKECEQEKE